MKWWRRLQQASENPESQLWVVPEAGHVRGLRYVLGGVYQQDNRFLRRGFKVRWLSHSFVLVFLHLDKMKHMERDLQLTGDSVLLRPYQRSDVNHLYEAVRESIAEVSVWMTWCHADYSIEESRTWIELQPEKWEKGTDYNFAIFDSGNDTFLGGCGLNSIGSVNRVANLGYWVRTSRTGRGIAAETTLVLARFGFDRLNLNRIEIVVAIDNKASQRVAEKAGAIREGIMRNRLVVHDKVYDAVMFSFIPRDLNP